MSECLVIMARLKLQRICAGVDNHLSIARQEGQGGGRVDGKGFLFHFTARSCQQARPTDTLSVVNTIRSSSYGLFDCLLHYCCPGRNIFGKS